MSLWKLFNLSMVEGSSFDVFTSLRRESLDLCSEWALKHALNYNKCQLLNMATRKGLIGIFGSRNVNLVVFQVVNNFPRRYFHKCVECGRIYGLNLSTANSLLKNFNISKSKYHYTDAMHCIFFFWYYWICI